jgi:hypothetical protein
MDAPSLFPGRKLMAGSAMLTFYTSQELIDELMSRPNFVGMVIRSPLENRNGVIHDLNDFILESTLDQTNTDTVLASAYHQVVERANCRFGNSASPEGEF